MDGEWLKVSLINRYFFLTLEERGKKSSKFYSATSDIPEWLRFTTQTTGTEKRYITMIIQDLSCKWGQDGTTCAMRQDINLWGANSSHRLVIRMHLHPPLSESHCWRVTAILGLLLINPKSPSFFSFLSQVITRFLRIRFQRWTKQRVMRLSEEEQVHNSSYYGHFCFAFFGRDVLSKRGEVM